MSLKMAELDQAEAEEDSAAQHWIHWTGEYLKRLPKTTQKYNMDNAQPLPVYVNKDTKKL